MKEKIEITAKNIKEYIKESYNYNISSIKIKGETDVIARFFGKDKKNTNHALKLKEEAKSLTSSQKIQSIDFKDKDIQISNFTDIIEIPSSVDVDNIDFVVINNFKNIVAKKEEDKLKSFKIFINDETYVEIKFKNK